MKPLTKLTLGVLSLMIGGTMIASAFGFLYGVSGCLISGGIIVIIYGIAFFVSAGEGGNI